MTARLLLWAGLLAAQGAFAHPEILAQIERLDTQLASEPGNAELLIRRGDLYRRHGDFELAAADFDAARSLEPRNPELDFYQGRLALEAGDPALAGQLLDRYLAGNPEQAAAWRLRALASEAQSDFEAAATAFGRAVTASQSPSPALYREWVLALDAAGDRMAALAGVDQGLSRLGTEVTLIGLGTDLALQAGDAMRARAYLERLSEGLKTLPQWQERLLRLERLERKDDGTAHPGGGEDSSR